MKHYSFYNNKQVLVTGGAGFIGSHLVESLVCQGAQVRVLDDLSTGFEENLASVIDNITFIKGSITDYQACLAATENVSIVFHCAAQVSVPDSVEHPAQCHAINVSGTANMLEACRVQGVDRFIFCSSAAVYGPCNNPCIEEQAIKPTSPYGYSKAMGESYCQQYTTIYGLATICTRFFNVFGRRQSVSSPYAGVVALFNRNLEHNQPISIYGNGLQTRDFIPVESVVQALTHLGSLPKEYLDGSSVNIATGKSITLLELFETLKRKYPTYQHSLQFKPARRGDIERSEADCKKLKQLLCLNPGS